MKLKDVFSRERFEREKFKRNIIVEDRNRIIMEGCDKVIFASTEKIVFQGDVILSVCGEGLEIVEIGNGILGAKGKISSIAFEDRKR